ncbi:MAG: glycine cleavage system protein GcvH [Fimbriiglobus sp.]|jgi:glycine cleavage system H protein|nr:glycine cleavage system protein GcvH [Fimbriiglobus sp.]
MSNPATLRYATSHEWVKLDGDVATVGVTKFAVEQLTEPTFLELKKVGLTVKPGDEIGIIESVKSTSSIYAPVAGQVVEVNAAAVNDLAKVNDDPFGSGWMLKIQLAPGATLDHLLTAAQYDAQIAGH